MYAAAILQLAIAILVSFALLGTSIGSQSRHLNQSNHKMILSTTLVEFHKTQCYFASAISIASIVVSEAMHYSEPEVKFSNFMILIPLALNGSVPVVATIQMISKYARLTWHTISLTAISLLLSTITLVKAYRAWGFATENSRPDQTDQMARLICGSKATDLNPLSPSTIDFAIVWLIYAFCVICFLATIIKHVCTFTEQGKQRNFCTKSSIGEYVTKNKRVLKILRALVNPVSLGMWLLCFTYVFYIYDKFRVNSFVSPEWTFGQIVAIAVWVPSIVEFLYMEIRKFFALIFFLEIARGTDEKHALVGIEEASKYRYPPGWRVVSGLVRASAGLANLELMRAATSTSPNAGSVSNVEDPQEDVEAATLESHG